MDEKYIKLLVDKCLWFNNKSLLISYNKLNKDFVNKLVNYAKTKGTDDVFLEEIDYNYKHDLLKESTIDEIKENDYFKAINWNEYAKKDATFLFIESEMPGLMDDIEPEKLALESYIRRSTKPVYNEKRDKGLISWCIAAYPNEVWAHDLFATDDAYDKLYDYIMKMCMIDTNNPLVSWDNQLTFADNMVNKLNNLKIKKLHYTNSLGTDLYLTLPDNYLYASAKDEKGIVNMPSYEVFTSPDYRCTEGIVYSALPLIHNGAFIDEFWIKFEKGKAIDCDAKKGKEVLEGIINSDPNACYLGEAALVNNDSPISNTGLVFKTTLFDENASCHLALGAGFNECLKYGLKMNEKELLSCGINQSKNHVDFMIGTPDLNIEATLENGDKILIFKDGNFCI
ncbi:MAG: aminopeptidase [Bacilli bacterium]|nr:aminopeptidase [Bacilli bacterium]